MVFKRVLATFGSGYDGRLGLGIECASQAYPHIVGSLVGYDIKHVACGGAHTAVVTDDGSLITFGLNDKGQLGHSKDNKFIPVPIEVGLPDAVKQVAAGEHHTLCLTTSGDVWAFGSNECGQLGVGQDADIRQVEPRLVKSLKGAKVTALAAGHSHSMALTASGEVLSWGHGESGALGHDSDLRGGAAKVQWKPKEIRSLEALRIRSVSAGQFSSAVIDETGQAYTWGHGIMWHLGHGVGNHEPRPRKLESLRGCGSISLGQMHSMATSLEGKVFTWGVNEHGSLGQGEGIWIKTPIKTPQEVPGAPRSKQVVCGWKHSCAVSTDGKLYTWGWAGSYNPGEGSSHLGHGDEFDKWAPNQVMRLRVAKERFYDLRMSYINPWKVQEVAAGRNHTAMVVDCDLDFRDLN
eukprot:gene13341-19182_t